MTIGPLSWGWRKLTRQLAANMGLNLHRQWYGWGIEVFGCGVVFRVREGVETGDMPAAAPLEIEA